MVGTAVPPPPPPPRIWRGVSLSPPCFFPRFGGTLPGKGEGGGAHPISLLGTRWVGAAEAEASARHPSSPPAAVPTPPSSFSSSSSSSSLHAGAAVTAGASTAEARPGLHRHRHRLVPVCVFVPADPGELHGAGRQHGPYPLQLHAGHPDGRLRQRHPPGDTPGNLGMAGGAGGRAASVPSCTAPECMEGVGG